MRSAHFSFAPFHNASSPLALTPNILLIPAKSVGCGWGVVACRQMKAMIDAAPRAVPLITPEPIWTARKNRKTGMTHF